MGSTISTMGWVQSLVTLALLSWAHAKGPLPDYMLGKFQLETSEGFSDFMYKIGVGWFNRALACTAYPIITITQSDDGTITEKTESSFKTSTKSFRLNEIYTKT